MPADVIVLDPEDAVADPALAGRGAISLDGRMVERLHLAEAERTLALARAIARREVAGVAWRPRPLTSRHPR